MQKSSFDDFEVWVGPQHSITLVCPKFSKCNWDMYFKAPGVNDPPVDMRQLKEKAQAHWRAKHRGR